MVVLPVEADVDVLGVVGTVVVGGTVVVVVVVVGRVGVTGTFCKKCFDVRIRMRISLLIDL